MKKLYFLLLCFIILIFTGCSNNNANEFKNGLFKILLIPIVFILWFVMVGLYGEVTERAPNKKPGIFKSIIFWIIIIVIFLLFLIAEINGPEGNWQFRKF
jgi:hypothetical protein